VPLIILHALMMYYLLVSCYPFLLPICSLYDTSLSPRLATTTYDTIPPTIGPHPPYGVWSRRGMVRKATWSYRYSISTTRVQRMCIPTAGAPSTCQSLLAERTLAANPALLECNTGGKRSLSLLFTPLRMPSLACSHPLPHVPYPINRNPARTF
jgi:hypothetical protein